MPATNYSLSGARDRFSNGSTAIDLAGGAAAAGSGAGAGSAGLASAGSGVGIGAEGPPANRHNSPPPTASNNASISSSPPPTVCAPRSPWYQASTSVTKDRKSTLLNSRH